MRVLARKQRRAAAPVGSQDANQAEARLQDGSTVFDRWPRRFGACCAVAILIGRQARAAGLAFFVALSAWIPSAAAQVADVQAMEVIDVRLLNRGGPPAVVSSVAISPDGLVLATGGDDHLVRLWNIVDGKLMHALRLHTDWVRAVAFDPTGERLASAGDDRKIALWDPSTGRPIRTLISPDAVYSLAFSSDGSLLAVAGFSDKLRLYDTRLGALVRELECPCFDTRVLAVSPDGRLLAAGGRDGRVLIWSLTGDSPPKTIQADRRRIRALAFAPDSSRLATAGDGDKIRLWDAATCDLATTLINGHGRTLSLVFCGPDRLASGGSNNLIEVWDLAAGAAELRLVGHIGTVTSLVYHAQSSLLASGSFDTTARLWNLGTTPPVRQAAEPRLTR